VCCYNGAQRYEQLLHIGQLHRGWSTVLGFDLTLALYLPSTSLVFVVLYILKIFLLTSFSLPYSELSLVGLALDVVD